MLRGVSRLLCGVAAAMRLTAASVLLLLPAVPSVAQVDEAALRELRDGLERAKRFSQCVSADVSETIEIVGKPPWKDAAEPEDRELKGKALYYRWGSVPGKRSYEWLWAGDRWRLREEQPIDDQRTRFTERRCNGQRVTMLTYGLGSHTITQGTIDHPRGTTPTPATFAYQPHCIWAADLLGDMRLRSVRRIAGPSGASHIECLGTYRGHETRLTFDPSHGYAMVEHEGDGERVGFAQRVTQWTTVSGVHIPLSMEQTLHSGPLRGSPIWRIMRLTVSNVRVGVPVPTDFEPRWPEGARIVNVPEGKMYQYTNGRMKFLVHVGGMTPQRRLLGWCVVAGVPIAGLLVLRLLTRRRRGADPAPT